MDKKRQPAKKEVGGAGVGNSGSKQADESLKESEERYREIFDTSNDALVIQDIATGSILDANKTMLKIYGYADKQEALKCTIEDLSALDEGYNKEKIIEMNQKAIDSNLNSFEWRAKKKGGEKFWAQVTLKRTRIGGESRIMASIRDITERKLAEEALRIKENTLTSSINAIALADLKGNLTYVNPAFLEMWGYSRSEEVQGEPSVNFWQMQEKAEAIIEVLRSNGGWRGELVARRKDGSYFDVQLSANMVTDETGNPICMSGAFIDITERKRTEEALKESEERYRSILEQMQDSYYEVDLAGNYTFVNESAGHSFGYSREEMIGQNYRLTVPDEDIKSIFAAYNEVYRTAKPNKGFPHRILHKDGSITFSEMSIDLNRNKRGEIIGFKSVSRDISERKHVEEELRKLASVVQYSSELVNLSTTEGKMIFLNTAGARMLGIDPQNSDQFNIMQVIPDHLKEKVQSELLPALLKGGTWEGDLQYLNLKTGLLTDVHAMAFAIKEPATGVTLYFANVSLDITERKQAEDAVRESERRFKNIIEHITDVFFILDSNRDLLYLSPQAEQVLGYTLEEVRNNWRNYMTDNPLNLAGNEKTTMAFTTGERQPPYLQEYMHRDGTKRLVENNESPLKNDKGEVIGIVGAIRDVTERKRSELALKESEEKYRSVVENALEAILIATEGMIVFTNNRTAVLTGYAQEELTSRPFTEFIHPDDRQMVAERYLQRLKGMDMSNINTFRVILKAGDIKWVEVAATVINWEGKPATLNFLTDITDSKRLEEEQQRVAKLESVGLLAGGIAHDFNNILTSILGNISLARTEAAPGSELLDSLEQAEKASLRAKDLTLQLLTFSKGGAPVTKLTSLAGLLKDTAGFALRGSNVKCHFSIPAGLRHAEVDAGQVSQVIHNLVINAQQAMPAGGSIEIGAENIALSEMQSLGRGLPVIAGDYIRIAVADHGTGIPKEHLDRIFDPFFSTKQKGSGLGLATSFSIARNHGGHISVESEPGSGSTFYLYLPASTETVTPEKAEKKATKPAGKARILVMDDEKEVREVAGRMLKHIGYKDIEFAKDGAEAIKLYKAAMESGKPFSVAILDLTIAGGMGGEVAIKKLLKIDPGVKAIVSSGYVDDSVIAKYKKHGFSGMVAKPYTLAELRKAVQDVIG